MEPSVLLKMFAAAPVARWMQGTLDYAPDGTAVLRLPARTEFLQGMNVVHGGIIAFAADTSAWFTAAAAMEGEALLTTAAFNLNLLRAAPAGAALRATSEVVKRGRSLVIVRTRVAIDAPAGEVLAEGLWTHVVLGGGA
ncbi:MAG: PaaI family thioesterase [Planctomycetes bacterium]|nr:PaaI family thioesterase [Planctomycetota bacterium]